MKLFLLFIYLININARGIEAPPIDTFDADLLATSFLTQVKSAGTVNMCQIDSQLNIDYYQQNKQLICSGLPCSSNDMQCIRRERGKKYDEFCLKDVRSGVLR